jgi:hypothetical protein
MMRMEVWSSAFTRSGGILFITNCLTGKNPISYMESLLPKSSRLRFTRMCRLPRGICNKR